VGCDLPGVLRSMHVRSRLRARQQREPEEVRDRPDLLKIEMMAEQVPNPRSRVTIQEDRDRFGARRAALEWHLTDDELLGFARAQQRFGEALEAAGFGEVYPLVGPGQLPRTLRGASHQMGTTRMHTDPRQGVTNEHGRVHGMRDVYVAGSSVFPTGGAANPTLTLLALTLRLADELAPAG
jgi:choline dehydrogenase-like flavoprotein